MLFLNIGPSLVVLGAGGEVFELQQKKKWKMGVSIPLPADCEPTALPSELIPQQIVPLCCSQVAIEVPKGLGIVHP